jgi:cytochrome oxidase assembly protein ShyY1
MKRRLAYWMFAALLIAGFCALGNWQWQRGVAKQAWIEAQARVMAERKALPLAGQSLQDTDALAWVAGRGHFARAPLLLLDNQRRGEQVGVRVLRVFAPDSGRALLVDLGWLPLPGNRKLPTPPPIEGDLDVRGLFGRPPSAGLAIGPDHAVVAGDTWLLTRVDLEALAQALHVDLAPRVLRLDPDLPIGHARDLAPLANTLPPERHRGYAVQWYGLAFATLVATLLLSFRRRP